MSDALRFEWDEVKATRNQQKHRVSFKEAASIFYDDYARLVADPDHSSAEDRFLLLGMSSRLRVLLVCHCYRESESVIRLISARRANRDEQESHRRRRKR